MRKRNSKHRTSSQSCSRQAAKQANAAAQTTTHKLVKPKRGTQPPPHRSSAKQSDRTETKQARILAMLRAPSGVTIVAMMHATGWQQHSVRGFLAGVVRAARSMPRAWLRSSIAAASTSRPVRNGQCYRVMVVDKGFVWNDKAFDSLSSIAFAITGSKWNGPRFFCLRDKAPVQTDP